MMLERKVLFLMQLPKPIHGVSVMNQIILDSPFFKDSKKKIINLNTSGSLLEIKKYSFRKILFSTHKVFSLIYQLIFFNPDLVYFSFFPYGKAFIRDAFFLFILKLFTCKVIIHIHNFGLIGTPVKNKLLRFLLKSVNIIVLSEMQREEEIIPLKLKKSEIFVLKNGIKEININSFEQKKEKQVVLLFLSNFFEEKGIFFLLDAFESYIRQTKNKVKLILSGQDFDNNKNKILNFVAHKDLTAYITIKENVFDKDKWQLYAMADIFIFPSYFKETSSLVIMEAMQFGLPVIASKTGVIPQLVCNGEDALLFPPKDKTLFLQSLDLLITDEEKRRNMGNKARENFLSKYSISYFYDNFQQILNKVMDE